MATVYVLFEWKQTIALTRLGLLVLNHYWAAFLKWRHREKLRAELYSLSDLELRDIGITRGEIDHIASHHRTIGPRDAGFLP